MPWHGKADPSAAAGGSSEDGDKTAASYKARLGVVDPNEHLYMFGYSSSAKCCWRLLKAHEKKPKQKEWSTNFAWQDGSADDDFAYAVFEDGMRKMFLDISVAIAKQFEELRCKGISTSSATTAALPDL